jgi:hypothetical protein
MIDECWDTPRACHDDHAISERSALRSLLGIQTLQKIKIHDIFVNPNGLIAHSGIEHGVEAMLPVKLVSRSFVAVCTHLEYE